MLSIHNLFLKPRSELLRMAVAVEKRKPPEKRIPRKDFLLNSNYALVEYIYLTKLADHMRIIANR